MNRNGLVIAGTVLNVAFLAILPFVTSWWPLLALCALSGMAGALSGPASSALAVEEGRWLGMGSTFSMILMMNGLGMSLGPVLCGAIGDSVNIKAVFFFGAVMTAIGLALFMYFMRRRSKPVKEAETIEPR